MISKRSILLLVGAVILSLPAANEMRKERPVCVPDSRLIEPAPPPVRLTNGTLSAARLLRVQERVQEDQYVSPCPTTGFNVFVRIVTFAAGCLWIAFLVSFGADVQEVRRRRRRARRMSRR